MLRKYVFGARFYVSDMFKCGSCGYATRIRVLGDTCTCPRCGATMRRHDAAPVIRREKRCGSFLQSSLEMCRLRVIVCLALEGKALCQHFLVQQFKRTVRKQRLLNFQEKLWDLQRFNILPELRIHLK